MQREAIMVLGMHRSGTSAMAGVSAALGATPPIDPLFPQPDNPKGFWESDSVVRLNDRILQTMGSDWSDWRAIGSDALRSAPARALAQEARSLLQSQFNGGSLIVLKDPRISRIYPLWQQALKQEGYAIHNVLMVRSPLEVALSLRKRNGFQLEHGLLLWLRYSLDMEYQSRSCSRSTVTWEGLHANWRREVARISTETGLVWPNVSDTKAIEIDDFVSPSLYNHQVADAVLSSDPRVHDLVLRAYSALKELASQPRGNAAGQELDDVRRSLGEADRLFSAMLAQSGLALKEADLRWRTAVQDEAVSSARLLEAEQARAVAESSLTTLVAEKSRVEDELQRVQNEVAAFTVELARSAEELAGSVESVRRLEAEAATLRADQTSLAAQLDQVILDRSTLAGEVAGLAVERDEALSEVRALSEHRAALQTEVAAHAADLSELAERLTAADRELSEVRDEVVKAVGQRDEALLAREDQAARTKTLEQDLAVARSEAGDLGAMLGSLETKLTSSKAEVKIVSVENDNLRRNLHDEMKRAEENEKRAAADLAEALHRGELLEADLGRTSSELQAELQAAAAAVSQLEEARRQAVLTAEADGVRAAAAIRRLATVENGLLFKIHRLFSGRSTAS